MGIQSQKILPHWNYLLAVERDLDELSRYVEFDQRNFGCFSIEIARILLAAGAETDVVCSQICTGLNPSSRAQNILAYRNEVVPTYGGFPRFKVMLPRFGLSLTPWHNWRTKNPPLWWTAYNKIKHHRNSEYSRASLKNALNAVAGLFVAVLHLYRDRAEAGGLLPSPELLRVDETHIQAFIENGYDSGVAYSL